MGMSPGQPSLKVKELTYINKQLSLFHFPSFRLFDEQKDVLILVFLEDIPMQQLSPYYRMRRLLKRQTYLSWSRADAHPDLFWEKLRQALETQEHPMGEHLRLTVEDGPPGERPDQSKV